MRSYNHLLSSQRDQVNIIKTYKFTGKYAGRHLYGRKVKKSDALAPNKRNDSTYLTNMQIVSLMILQYAVEYGFALEVVFISPLFLKLDTPDLLDSSIWLFPPVMNLLIYPFVKFYSECKEQQARARLAALKNAIIVFIFVSLLGIGILADTKSLIIHLITDKNKKTGVLIVSIISFTIMDVGLEMLQCSCQMVLDDFVHPKQQELIQYYSTIVNSFGKFSGFMISSVLAFNFIYLNFDNFIENLSFAYFVGLVIILLGFGLILISFTRVAEQNSMELCMPPEKIQLSLNSFLPGLTFINKIPNSMKLLLISHFFTCGAQLFVSCYATLWAGITMLEEGPKEYNQTIINIVFDIGISWGALALCISAIFHLLTTLFLHQVKTVAVFKYCYIIVNALAGITLLYTWAINEFYSIFITLPFWGISMAVLQEVPQRLAIQLENQVPQYNINYKANSK